MSCFKRFLFCTLLLNVGLVALKAQPKKTTADKIIAVIGDHMILQSDIKNSIADLERNNQDVPAGATCAMIERAMISKLLMLQAEKDSLFVSDEAVEAELDQKIRWYIRKLGSREALEASAGKSIFKIKDESREFVKENMMAENMRQVVVANIKITPAEVESFFNKIPKDKIPYLESQYEIGQIVIYPKASRAMEQHVIAELMSYKRQIDSKAASFEQLVRYSEDAESIERLGQYELNRNDRSWDPAFLTAAFRLKAGEVSAPVKSQFGYHLIKLVERKGDDAVVRHILRIPVITDADIVEVKGKLDTVRAKILAGAIPFTDAAKKYSNDESVKFTGPWMLSNDGSGRVTIDQLDKEMVTCLASLKAGELSQPVGFADDRGRKAGRIVYLKSMSTPHLMNLREDYIQLSQLALEEKRNEALSKWIKVKLPTYYIQLDPEISNECKQLSRYASNN